MKALNVVIILLSVVCTACTAIGMKENNKVEEVSFGSGGGFTGEIIKYTMNRDGNIYRNGSFIKCLFINLSFGIIINLLLIFLFYSSRIIFNAE